MRDNICRALSTVPGSPVMGVRVTIVFPSPFDPVNVSFLHWALLAGGRTAFFFVFNLRYH